MIATLLTIAALICLAVGARLLVASGEQASALVAGSDGGRFVGTVTLIGGALVFLLSTVAILAARRFAVSATVEPDNWTGHLELTSIQDWSRDLTSLRDDLQREVFAAENELTIEHLEIEVPHSWRAKGDYLLDEAGAALDPLADVKRTRDRLMDAATRVDDIVQSINASTPAPSIAASSARSVRRWWRWWRS